MLSWYYNYFTSKKNPRRMNGHLSLPSYGNLSFFKTKNPQQITTFNQVLSHNKIQIKEETQVKFSSLCGQCS